MISKVGFLGVQCDSPNLGLGALTCSAVAMLHELVPQTAEFVLFSINSTSALDLMHTELRLGTRVVRAVPFRHKQPRAMLGSFREIKGCDVVIDFTGGDSFSDIYGPLRLVRKLFHKQLVLFARTPLVLAPQTYGPLRRRWFRPWYRHVLRRAALVFSRDDASAEFVAELAGIEALRSTDVAVTLPHSPGNPAAGRRRVGLNVSGLLWAGGYTGNNQFGLRTDYRDWCRRVVSGLVERGCDVVLVPHVRASTGAPDSEDDGVAAAALQAEFPKCGIAPAFTSAVAAKSWISQLDLLVGSRMHATIASFSTGVPTVPVAYSRKFAGFFGTLGYPVLVDLTAHDTATAASATLEWVDRTDAIRELAEPAMASSAKRIQVFREQLHSHLQAL